MPPGNFAFLTPSVTPRPQNRPRKKGKLTPGKNPSTTGSAGRSDPARDASSDPGPFTCSFFTPLTTAGFWGTRVPDGKPNAGVFFVCAGGCFPGWAVFFLSPVWPKPPPDRAGTGRSPTWGGNRPKRASWGRIWALRGFVGRLAVGGSPQCRKERKGRRIPLEGSGRDLRHLLGNPHGRKRGKCRTLFLPCPTKYRWTWSAAHKIQGFIHVIYPFPPVTHSEQERRQQQGGSQPAPSFQHHLRHWW